MISRVASVAGFDFTSPCVRRQVYTRYWQRLSGGGSRRSRGPRPAAAVTSSDQRHAAWRGDSPSTRNNQNGGFVQRGWCGAVERPRLASSWSFERDAKDVSVNTRSRITQHGRPEEPARRAGDERLAFQVDQLLERLSTEMVRPVKRASVVLQVVSYVSSDLPLPIYLSLYLPPLLNSSACATVYASLDTLVITLYDRSWRDRMPRLGPAVCVFLLPTTVNVSPQPRGGKKSRDTSKCNMELFSIRV